jgi:RNA polymerase sigma-70 factor (ECF subfamily)
MQAALAVGTRDPELRAARGPHRPRGPRASTEMGPPGDCGGGRFRSPSAGPGRVPFAMSDSRAHGLLRGVAHGDRAALGESVRPLAALVHGLALRVLRDCLRAEDVVQEVFVQVWRQAGRYDRLPGTAGGLGVHRWHGPGPDRRRRRASRREDPSEAATFPGRAPGPGDLPRRARRAGACSSDEQRRAVELAHVRGPHADGDRAATGSGRSAPSRPHPAGHDAPPRGAHMSTVGPLPRAGPPGGAGRARTARTSWTSLRAPARLRGIAGLSWPPTRSGRPRRRVPGRGASAPRACGPASWPGWARGSPCPARDPGRAPLVAGGPGRGRRRGSRPGRPDHAHAARAVAGSDPGAAARGGACRTRGLAAAGGARRGARGARPGGPPRVAADDTRGLDPAPGARGRVLWNAGTREAILLASGLGKPPAGKAYEIWVIGPSKRPVPAGVFQPGPDAARSSRCRASRTRPLRTRSR